jgi:ribosome-binding protein aMBF1 (putative translation factor)
MSTTAQDFDPKMIANNLTPAFPTHPGEILKDEIEYRGISQRKLAAEMGVTCPVLNEILNARRPVTEKRLCCSRRRWVLMPTPLIASDFIHSCVW